MRSNVPILCLASGSLMVSLAFGRQADSKGPLSHLSDAEIRRILTERVDTYHQNVGIVVGIVTPNGRRVFSSGRFGLNDARPVTGETIFEIGSVTKVFTARLLADMMQRGEANLADPAARYLPAGVTIKTNNAGKTITLADLATHTAGLPFWPSNVPATGDLAAALADYTVPPRK